MLGAFAFMKIDILNMMSCRKAFGYTAVLITIMAVRIANGQGTIISVSGPPDGVYHQYGATLTTNGYPAGVSWIAAGAYSNVSISILLDGDSGATGMAYLTTRIGSGTTTASQIASSSFSFPSTQSFMPVLSGFSLAAGTYYLIVQQTATGSSGNGLWEGTPSPTITSAANVTANGEYDYDNTFSGYTPSAAFVRAYTTTYYEYYITGSPVPEPSAPLLVLLGCGVAICFCTRRQPPNTSLEPTGVGAVSSAARFTSRAAGGSVLGR
jgi:hypothetical protein